MPFCLRSLFSPIYVAVESGWVDGFVCTWFSCPCTCACAASRFHTREPRGCGVQSPSERARCPALLWSARLFHCSVGTFVTSIRFHSLSYARNPYPGERQFGTPAALRVKARCEVQPVIRLRDTISRSSRLYIGEEATDEIELNKKFSCILSYCITCNFFRCRSH